jgi:hypothetical protein
MRGQESFPDRYQVKNLIPATASELSIAHSSKINKIYRYGMDH